MCQISQPWKLHFILNIKCRQNGNSPAGRLPANIRRDRCTTQEEQIYDAVTKCSFWEIMATVSKKSLWCPRVRMFYVCSPNCLAGLGVSQGAADFKTLSMPYLQNSKLTWWRRPHRSTLVLTETNCCVSQKVLPLVLNEFIGNRYPLLVHSLRPWPPPPQTGVFSAVFSYLGRRGLPLGEMKAKKCSFFPLFFALIARRFKVSLQ